MNRLLMSWHTQQKKTRLISLAELRAQPELADMVILKRGNRLSITPVSAAEWRCLQQMAK